MSVQRVSDYQERKERVPPFEIRIVSYRVGENYFAQVDNVNPGAVLARNQGKTREEVEKEAIAKAKEYLSQTRIIA